MVKPGSYNPYNSPQKYFDSGGPINYKVGISLKITTYIFPSLFAPTTLLRRPLDNPRQSPVTLLIPKLIQKAITWSNKCALTDKENTQNFTTFNFKYLEYCFFSPHHLCYFAISIQGKVELNLYRTCWIRIGWCNLIFGTILMESYAFRGYLCPSVNCWTGSYYSLSFNS